jgi:hypothetical protein
MNAIAIPHHTTKQIVSHNTVRAEKVYWNGEPVVVYYKVRNEYNAGDPLASFSKATSIWDDYQIVAYHPDTPVGGKSVFNSGLEPENDVVGVIVTVVGETPPGEGFLDKLSDPVVIVALVVAAAAGFAIGRATARRQG